MHVGVLLVDIHASIDLDHDSGDARVNLISASRNQGARERIVDRYRPPRFSKAVDECLGKSAIRVKGIGGNADVGAREV